MIPLAYALQIALTVAANLLMKQGAGLAKEAGIFPFFHPVVIAGVACFGCAAVIYAWLLQRQPLHIAQSFIALQFIAVIIAAAMVVGEPITWQRWLGAALIAGGVLVVGLDRSDHGPESAAAVEPVSEDAAPAPGR